MTKEEKEYKLKRLRNVWKFAKSRNKEAWARQIETDANKLKSAATEEEATPEEIEDIFGAKME